MLGSDQDIDAGIFTLLIEELEKISFPITYVHDPRLWHGASQFHQITMMLNPDKGFFSSIGICEGLRWSLADLAFGARHCALITPSGSPFVATAKVECKFSPLVLAPV